MDDDDTYRAWFHYHYSQSHQATFYLAESDSMNYQYRLEVPFQIVAVYMLQVTRLLYLAHHRKLFPILHYEKSQPVHGLIVPFLAT